MAQTWILSATTPSSRTMIPTGPVPTRSPGGPSPVPTRPPPGPIPCASPGPSVRAAPAVEHHCSARTRSTHSSLWAGFPEPQSVPMRRDERLASMLERAREVAARGHYPMMIESVLAANGFAEAAEWIDQPHIRRELKDIADRARKEAVGIS